MGTDRYDIDLEARMVCTINVADFDETKYTGQEELTGAVRAKMYEMIGQSLEELAPISIMLKAAWDGQAPLKLRRQVQG